MKPYPAMGQINNKVKYGMPFGKFTKFIASKIAIAAAPNHIKSLYPMNFLIFVITNSGVSDC